MTRRTMDPIEGLELTRSGPFLIAGPAPIELPADLAAIGRGDRPIFGRARGCHFTAAAAGAVTEVEIFDEIGGWGVTTAMIAERLRGAGDVRLKINSPGGDVFDGIGIYNALVNHAGQVSIEVIGIAASAASIVAMAGDHLAIAENAFLMIHNSWTWAAGDRRALRETADVLEKVDGALAATYAARSDLTIEEAAAIMDAETWLTAAEAADAGLVDEVLPFAEPSAAFELRPSASMPAVLTLYSQAAAGRLSIRDLEQGLRDAGRSRAQAQREARALFALAPREAAPPRAGGPPRDAAGDERIAAAMGRLIQTLTT